MEKPAYYKSAKGNLFEYDKYSNIDEPKWWPPLPSEDSRLYMPLPLDEYPYEIIYEKKGD